MLTDNSARSAKLDAISNIIYYQAYQINVQTYIFQGFARNANTNLGKKIAAHSQRNILGKPSLLYSGFSEIATTNSANTKL
jgi:hypothetical protein